MGKEDYCSASCDKLPASTVAAKLTPKRHISSKKLAIAASITDADLHKLKEKAIIASRSDNTRDAYNQAVEHYRSIEGPLPAKPDDIANYLLRCQNVYAYATLEMRLSALARWHQVFDHPDPTKGKLVATVLKGIRRQVNTQQKKAPPMMASDLVSIIDELRKRSAGGGSDARSALRNETMLLTGYFGMLRVSELTGLRREDVRFAKNGADIFIRQSKNDKSDKGILKSIPNAPPESSLCPVYSLRKWIDSANLEPHEYLFTSNVTLQPLSTRSINKLLKSLSAYAITLNEQEFFSSHSMRRGCASQASQLGERRGVIKRQGAWKTDKIVGEYIDEGNRFERNPAHAIYSLL